MRMNTGYNRMGEYDHYVVNEQKPLLEWLLENVKESRTKIKATLQGRGIKVNGKTVTQFDFQLERGMKVAVSKTKRNQQSFKSRYVKIVYEDQWLIVVEKNIGILSMAAGHSSLNVKSVLDDYFKKSRQKCTAHVVHRLDRDTSGLMVYAKDMETEQILEHNWHQIVYDRRYVAVVSGEMEQDEGTIQNWPNWLSRISMYWTALPNIRLWNISWRRVARTRFAYILPTWGIPYAAIPNTAMATTPFIASACMPGSCASRTPARANPWSLRPPYPQLSVNCLSKIRKHTCLRTGYSMP